MGETSTEALILMGAPALTEETPVLGNEKRVSRRQ